MKQSQKLKSSFGGKRKKRSFYRRVKRRQNHEILSSLRRYIATKIFKLSGIDYFSLYPSEKDFVVAPKAGAYLRFISETHSVESPASQAKKVETYAWMRRFDALSEKNISIPTGINTNLVAYETFLETERTCWKTNQRFLSGKQTCAEWPRGDVLLERIRRKISVFLGEVPSLADLKCSFGPGANTTCRRKTSIKWKLSSTLAFPRDALGSLNELQRLYPRLAWETCHADVGLLFFVAKNSKTARQIVIEPTGATFVQRGIGRHMKRGFLRYGLNLYDQSINREKARVGSLTGSDGTVDLSTASNLIAFMLCHSLLPWEWFCFLAEWRSDTVTLNDRNLVKGPTLHPLQMFSSMGNGFTFELQSCIFYAIAQVACELAEVDPKRASVFGDDIVVPTEAIPHLFEMLELCGFRVNKEKSYWTGYFRESCGGDYLLGVDVRPFYVKDAFTDARLIAMSNQIARSGYPDPDFRKLIESFLEREPFYGPDGYGDGHLIGYHVDKKPHRPFDGWSGYCFRTVIKVPRRDEAEPKGYALVPAYEAYMSEDSYLAPCSGINLTYVRSAPLAEVRDFVLRHTIGFSRESDPHVLRGGELARTIRVYVPY